MIIYIYDIESMFRKQKNLSYKQQNLYETSQLSKFEVEGRLIHTHKKKLH